MSKRFGRFSVVAIAYDAFSLLAVAAVFSFAFVTPAFAYVDPSVMTYAIQAIAGIAVALSTVLGVVLRRTRKKLFKALGIDENARKDVEPRVHRLDGSGNPIITEADKSAEYLASGKAAKLQCNRSSQVMSDFSASWKKRVIFAAIVSVFTSFTLCVVAPYELVAASVGSLVVGLGDIALIMAVCGLALAVVLTVALTCMRGNVFRICALAVFAIGLCFYIQALFLNGGLPQADGKAVAWGDYLTITAISLLAWIAVVACVVVLGLKFRKQTQVVAGALSVALVIVQGVGVASLFVDYSQAVQKGANQVVMQQGLFDVSSNENVIEFVLDNFDTATLKAALEEEPDVLDGMTGFTWYPDSVGSMIPTRYGNVFLLTGEYPHSNELFSTFLDQRYDRSNYLEDISNAGFDIGIYSDTLGEGEMRTTSAKEQIYDLANNIHELDSSAVDPLSTAAALMQCALYRDAPWIVKPLFWFYTGDINKRVVSGDAESDETTPYVIDDSKFFNRLKTSGLKVNDENASYRYIHLDGAHDPFSLNREGEYVGLWESTQLDQAIGSLRIVEKYLEELKELGVYDNTTIVITTDHGDWWSQMEDLQSPKSSILLVKPAKEGTEQDAPIVVSSQPVNAANVVGTVIQAVGANAEGYAPAVSKLDPSDNQTRYFYMTTSNGVHDQEIQEYKITGDVSDIANWSRTENVWAAQE